MCVANRLSIGARERHLSPQSARGNSIGVPTLKASHPGKKFERCDTILSSLLAGASRLSSQNT